MGRKQKANPDLDACYPNRPAMSDFRDIQNGGKPPMSFTTFCKNTGIVVVSIPVIWIGWFVAALTKPDIVMMPPLPFNHSTPKIKAVEPEAVGIQAELAQYAAILKTDSNPVVQKMAKRELARLIFDPALVDPPRNADQTPQDPAKLDPLEGGKLNLFYDILNKVIEKEEPVQ